MTSAESADAVARALDEGVTHAGLDATVAGPLAVQARRCARLWRELDRDRLVVALFGGTGVGKSTLVNAIAGRTISHTGERRPTTDRIVCHRHRDAPTLAGIRDDDLAPNVGSHDVAALRDVVLLDLPDMDSYVVAHAERVARVLPEVDVLLVVASPEKYASRDLFDALARLPQSPCSVVFVLNAVDRLSASERSAVLDDFRARIATHAREPERSDVSTDVAARAHAREPEAPDVSADGHARALLALSARDALAEDEAVRTASGISALVTRMHELGRGGARRRVLLDNARAASRTLAEALERATPAAALDAWIASLDAVAARDAALDTAARASLHEALAHEIHPRFADRAERASGFPIFELAWLRGLLRPSDAPGSALGARLAALLEAEERLVDLPLAIARREAALAATAPPTLPFAPVPVPSAPLGNRDDAADPLMIWQSGLARRADQHAWRVRQHVVPALVGLLAGVWVALPQIVHALDPAAAGAAAREPGLAALLERATALPWLGFAAGGAIWYVLVLPRFARRIRRAVDSDTTNGIDAFAAHATTRFDREFVRPWHASVAALRRLADTLRAGRGFTD